MNVEICDYTEGHFFCILPKGDHGAVHGGYNDEECPWGEYQCVCESDPALTAELEKFLCIEELGHNVSDFLAGREE